MSIKQKVVHGVAWRSIVNVSNIALQIVFTAILARFLSLAEFGIVAMALLMGWFILSFTRVGCGTAIIQSQDINNGQITAIFILHLFASKII